MAGEQDILDLGLDISSFNQEKMNRLKEFIQLFNDLSKYDGKVFNPILGDGLTQLNTSINNTNRLLDEMKSKFESVVSKRYNAQGSGFTDLSLGVQQYSKELDKNAQLQAKLSVVSSDVAKENIALKLKLSDTTKEIINQAKLSEELSRSFGIVIERSEEYIAEQERVVATLRAVSIEQEKQAILSNRQYKRIQDAEYRTEQQRVVATLRSLAIEQDKKIDKDIKEQIVIKNLARDYGSLSNSIKSQSERYRELYVSKGKDAPETKAALSEYRAVSSNIDTLNYSLGKTDTSIKSIGHGLGSALNQLRNLAYILPGIGLAGIFNIAFIAIGKVIDSFVSLGSSEEDLIEKQNRFNKALTESVNNMNTLIGLRKSFTSITGSAYVGEAVEKRVRDEQISLSNLESEGQSKDKLLDAERSLIEAEKEKNKIRVLSFGGIDKLENQVNYKLDKLGIIKDEINKLSFSITQKVDYVDLITKNIIRDSDTKQKKKESLQIEFDILQKDLNDSADAYKEYYNIREKLSNKDLEIQKFNDDQVRKKRLETSKDDISVNLEKNKQILNDDKKFHDDKEKAIKNTLQQEQKLNYETYINIRDNVSITPKEKEIAANKLIDDNIKANLKAKEAINKNDVEFYQRKILAETEIQKDIIELDAIANEKIFQNDQKSLEERLNAYENYIIKKQQIRDLEASISLQRGAAGPGKPTSLIPEEQDRINQHKITEQYNIQADAEKKVYDITKQFYDERLRLVKLQNESEYNIDKTAYAKELEATNERFKNKIFAYKSFKKNIEFIDKKYGVIITTQQEIEKDDANVKRLKGLYDELVNAKKESDERLKLIESKTTPIGAKENIEYKRKKDEETGRGGAIQDEILKVQKELADSEAKGDNDRIKAAKARYEQLIQFAREHAANLRSIEEGIFDVAKKYANAGVDEKINAIERQTEARNEQSALEQEGIENATLSVKDKLALERQLAQEKIELDKNAALQERKLRHDAAQKEHDIAVAEILFNTGVAVTSALKIPPPAGEILAAERAILGGIQLALLPPVPSYKEGIRSTPKTEFARFGEAGPELVKEPGKNPFIAFEETIRVLEKGTQIVPMRSDYPEFSNERPDESWNQTRYLADYIAKSNKKSIVNIFKPTIVVDMNFESRKRQILGN